jgi:hypothetical protein
MVIGGLPARAGCRKSCRFMKIVEMIAVLPKP